MVTVAQGADDGAAQDPAAGSPNLDAIAREADRLDKGPEEAAASERREVAAEVVNSNRAELLAGLTMARDLVLPLLAQVLPEPKVQALGNVWSDQVLDGVAAAGAEVLEMHGVQVGSVLGTYGPYIALAVAVAPPMVLTKKILAMPAAPQQVEGGKPDAT